MGNPFRGQKKRHINHISIKLCRAFCSAYKPAEGAFCKGVLQLGIDAISFYQDLTDRKVNLS